MAGHLALLLSACRQAGKVCVDGREDEKIITLIADGAMKAGNVVYNNAGTIAGTDDGAAEYFKGIQLPRYDTDCDTAPTAGVLVEVVLPQDAHRYNVATVDPGADKADGLGMVFGTTVGNMEIGGGDVVVFHPAKLSGAVANTSRFVEIVWGGGA